MPVKIRLQRHGKKGKPFYWVVAADGRSKRDGKSLEKLGTYNPNLNPAVIDLDIDATVKWLQNGAQPTDTARAILSYKGVMLKNHLLGGVKKGALTEEQAEEKFQAWVTEKENKITDKENKLTKASDSAKAKILETEKEVNTNRKAAVAEAENEAIKAEADAKAAEVAATKAKEAPENDTPQTIDEAVEEAKEDVSAKVEETIEAKTEEAPKAETEETPETKTTEEAPAEKTKEEEK
ncbi:MAG: 30S ribosomal protein S16 [Flavobacteriaceae bacterium]|nr:30S ribosomal protein S16 [Flavobacteriaceae bacterium]